VVYFDGHTDTVNPLRNVWKERLGGGIDCYDGLLDAEKVPEENIQKVRRRRTKKGEEGRREKGEGRREKGEGRREKGEGRREKGEGRREKGEEGDLVAESTVMMVCWMLRRSLKRIWKVEEELMFTRNSGTSRQNPNGATSSLDEALLTNSPESFPKSFPLRSC
jgi:hypothetical protein